ncbi:LytR C-terminal domain-containing protein [Isoptericola variabilis]|uniref:LytR/CpsA/Psr regulator C-terminal domain-containing protein n=1 Tax=Isoptericola variabilis (strain 225) TaxID=743718 RepID=F6FUL4_ISOV2|nr:LytR C-terminal domain-containing protein [Isoptericola variabilis]AEG45441.1 hypothetical protein Isova_2745 [Isoptericola variabilis 225]TWH31537.1 LytR cell envelope-related transcriptional attenuator [Isoptericola variabilis J7]
MTSPAHDPVRVELRRRERERQAVVFGLLIAVLAVSGLGALALYTGAIESPFDQPIRTPGTEAAPAGPVPCLPAVEGQPDGALPVAYSDVEVRVINASTTSGLAGAHAEVLRDRGFNVVLTGDLDHLLTHSELRFGTSGIVAAYTLAAQLSDVRMVLDDRQDAVVDLLVGEEYERPVPEEEVALRADEPLQNAPGCVQVEEITPVAQEYAVGQEPTEEAAEEG